MSLQELLYSKYLQMGLIFICLLSILTFSVMESTFGISITCGPRIRGFLYHSPRTCIYHFRTPHTIEVIITLFAFLCCFCSAIFTGVCRSRLLRNLWDRKYYYISFVPWLLMFVHNWLVYVLNLYWGDHFIAEDGSPADILYLKGFAMWQVLLFLLVRIIAEYHWQITSQVGLIEEIYHNIVMERNLAGGDNLQMWRHFD